MDNFLPVGEFCFNVYVLTVMHATTGDLRGGEGRERMGVGGRRRKWKEEKGEWNGFVGEWEGKARRKREKEQLRIRVSGERSLRSGCSWDCGSQITQETEEGRRGKALEEVLDEG